MGKCGKNFNTGIYDVSTCTQLFPSSRVPSLVLVELELDITLSASLLNNRFSLSLNYYAQRASEHVDGRSCCNDQSLRGIDWLCLFEVVSHEDHDDTLSMRLALLKIATDRVDDAVHNIVDATDSEGSCVYNHPSCCS